MTRPFRLLPLAAAFVVLAGTAQAATFYIATATTQCRDERNSTQDFADEGQPAAATSATTFGSTGCVVSSQSRANAEGLGTFAAGSGTLPQGAGSARSLAAASAEMQLTFRLTTPDGYDGGPIAVGANFDLTGMVFGTIAPAFDQNGDQIDTSRGILSTLDWLVQLTGTGQGAFESGRIQTDVRDEGVGTASDQQSIDSRISSGIAMLDPFEDINLRVNLSSQVSTTFFGDPMSGTADAFNSLTFATQGAVFDLPDGFSVTIAEAGVIDNRYGSAPAPVPLPAAGWALLAAIAALAGVRRRAAA